MNENDFIWSDSLLTGNQFIDDDHKQMFVLIKNLLCHNVSRRESYEFLIHYFTDHIKAEEALMVKLQLTNEHISAHTNDHQRLQDILLFQHKPTGEDEFSIYVTDFLLKHLVPHIKKYDVFLKEP